MDAYLASVPKAHRPALDKLRSTIRAMVPGAAEAISYGLPAFKYKGKPLAGYASYKDHCSYFPMSGRVISGLRDELKAYETTKGAIHFQAEKPLPVNLVKKLLNARIQEIDKQ